MPSVSADRLLFERRHWDGGIRLIAGLDEVGRGALAGPVVVAAVVLMPGTQIPDVRDSKLLTAKKRESLYQEIIDSAYNWSVAAASAGHIDRMGILNATFRAMALALSRLAESPALVLVDGRLAIPPQFLVQRRLPAIQNIAIVGGDDRSASIAAASIIAKVTRDRLLSRLHRLYPDFGWDGNKGYGTAKHLEELNNRPPTPHHRLSFAPLKCDNRLNFDE